MTLIMNDPMVSGVVYGVSVDYVPAPPFSIQAAEVLKEVIHVASLNNASEYEKLIDRVYELLEIIDTMGKAFRQGEFDDTVEKLLELVEKMRRAFGHSEEVATAVHHHDSGYCSRNSKYDSCAPPNIPETSCISPTDQPVAPTQIKSSQPTAPPHELRPHRRPPLPPFPWEINSKQPTAPSYIEPLFDDYLCEEETEYLGNENADLTCACHGCGYRLQYKTVKHYNWGRLERGEDDVPVNGEQWRTQELDRLQYLQATNPLVHRSLPELASDRTDDIDEQLDRCRSWIISTIGEESFVDPFTNWPIQSDEEKFHISQSEAMDLDDATKSQVVFLGINKVRLTMRGEEHMAYHIPDADSDDYEAGDGYGHLYYSFTRFPFAKNCLWHNMYLLTGMVNKAKMAVYDGVNFKPGWHELEQCKALLQERGQWNRIDQEAHDVEEEDWRDFVKERSLYGGKVFYWYEARTETNALTASETGDDDDDDDDDTGSTVSNVSTIFFPDDGESSTTCSSEDDSICENAPLREDTKQVFGLSDASTTEDNTAPVALTATTGSAGSEVEEDDDEYTFSSLKAYPENLTAPLRLPITVETISTLMIAVVDDTVDMTSDPTPELIMESIPENSPRVDSHLATPKAVEEPLWGPEYCTGPGRFFAGEPLEVLHPRPLAVPRNAKYFLHWYVRDGQEMSMG